MDVNIDVLKVTNPVKKRLSDILRSFGRECSITSPTRGAVKYYTVRSLAHYLVPTIS